MKFDIPKGRIRTVAMIVGMFLVFFLVGMIKHIFRYWKVVFIVVILLSSLFSVSFADIAVSGNNPVVTVTYSFSGPYVPSYSTGWGFFSAYGLIAYQVSPPDNVSVVYVAASYSHNPHYNSSWDKVASSGGNTSSSGSLRIPYLACYDLSYIIHVVMHDGSQYVFDNLTVVFMSRESISHNPSYVVSLNNCSEIVRDSVDDCFDAFRVWGNCGGYCPYNYPPYTTYSIFNSRFDKSKISQCIPYEDVSSLPVVLRSSDSAYVENFLQNAVNACLSGGLYNRYYVGIDGRSGFVLRGRCSSSFSYLAGCPGFFSWGVNAFSYGWAKGNSFKSGFGKSNSLIQLQ